jgi:F-type H+-transporting ATPase subunit b
VEFDWTTFLFEIVNFLILIWILQRFLYRPVQAVIRRRQEAIAHTLSEARDAQAEAERVRQQYENRLATWEREKADARARLAEEIESERTRRMATLQTELAREQERRRVLEARRAEDARRRSEEEAMNRAAVFGARLLTRVVTPDLEARIVEVFLEDLRKLPAETCEPLRAACREDGAHITVTSAYPLGADQRSRLIAALGELADGGVVCEFVEDPALLGGVQVGIGPWVLRANLRDELRFFAETSHESSE